MTANKTENAPKAFVQLLKKAMDEHPDKLSLREVARRSDLSPAYLSYLLSGDRGVPSNDAVERLEEVLHIPEGRLFQAAGKPDDRALEFFRKDEAASIVRSLAKLPASELPGIRKMIERHLKKSSK